MTETRSKRRCKFVFFRIRINHPFRISKKYFNDYFNLFNFAFEEVEFKKKKKKKKRMVIRYDVILIKLRTRFLMF